MHKDEAMQIAHEAHTTPIERLLEQYKSFHNIVENTPGFDLTYDNHGDEFEEVTYPHPRSLHGAMGLATEAIELLDMHKKMIFGKRKVMAQSHVREECGDAFFYLFLILDAHGITLHDIIADNVAKLANRYIENFAVTPRGE